MLRRFRTWAPTPLTDDDDADDLEHKQSSALFSQAPSILTYQEY